MLESDRRIEWVTGHRRKGTRVTPSRARVNKVLRSAFGLTPAETRIAIGISRGKSPAVIAKSHGVAVATVRTQLKSVFAKTRTHRQAELAAFVGHIRMGLR